MSLKILLAIIVLFSAALIPFYRAYDSNQTPKWDGLIYNNIVQHYINNDYSFKNYDQIVFPEWQKARFSYLNRIFYVWFVAHVHKLTNIKLNTIYPYLSLLAYFFAAFTLFIICFKKLNYDFITSLFSGIFLLVCPPVLVMYEVIAHPEPLAMLFTVLSYYFYLDSNKLLTLTSLLIALLTKETALFLALYLVLKEVFNKNYKYVFLILTVSALGYLLPNLFISGYSFDHFSNIIGNYNYNQANVLDRLLYNFNILWVAYFTGLLFISKKEKATHGLIIFAALIAMLGVTDWWRVLYAPLFFLVLPLAAKTTTQIFYNKYLKLVVLITITIILIFNQTLVAKHGIPQTSWLLILITLNIYVAYWSAAFQAAK